MSKLLKCNDCHHHIYNGGDCEDCHISKPCRKFTWFEDRDPNPDPDRDIDQLIEDATEAMRRKLMMNTHKGSFILPTEKNYNLVVGEVKELRQAILSGDLRNVIDESADIMNYGAMMIYNVLREIRAKKIITGKIVPGIPT